MRLCSFREAVITAAVAVFVIADMSAGPVTRHAAEIAIVIRSVLAGLAVVLAAAVVTLTCYAVSARPVICQRPRRPDDDLPPPAQPDPGWVKVASVHRPVPAAPVLLPGARNIRRPGVVDSGRQEDDQEVTR